MHTDRKRGTQAQRTVLHSRAERRLSSLVTTIEFTLISVMAGVVLAPLASSASELFRSRSFEYWPYILFGLLYILFMWSGVISHAFTFVGWPFELGHNLFYIVWALVLAMQTAFMRDPLAWHAANIAQYLVVGWIGFYDQQILKQRVQGASGATRNLYELALVRQNRLIRMFPFAVGSAVISFGALLLFPGTFLGLHAHWMLGIFQCLVAGAGLYHNARSYRIWEDAIVEKAMEELRESDPALE